MYTAYTRKYTFQEARGTRSCIRLHGMGVPIIMAYYFHGHVYPYYVYHYLIRACLEPTSWKGGPG